MTDIIIRHICNGCGEPAEMTTKNEIDQHRGDEVLLLMVEPCSKCMKSQAEGMIEAIELKARIYAGSAGFGVTAEDAINKVVKFIKELGGLS